MYLIDKGVVLQNLYHLLCLFFANKEIARRSNPENENALLRSLETRFFVAEASRLLIEVAVAVRVIDDQMKKRPQGSAERKQYEAIKAKVDHYEFGLFDELNLDLRQTCNKIIHSDVMEPHSSPGVEGHELDYGYRYGEDEKSIDWEHFNGFVRLAGTDRGKEWFVLLDLEVFVSAVYELLAA